MSKLRQASKETTRLDLGDGDFLTVRSDLSKKVFNQLMLAMPNRVVDEEHGLTPKEGMDFARALFDVLVEGWSLPVPATVEEYDELSTDSAAEVDTKLIEHFGNMTPTKDEMSKVATSPSKKRKD